MTSNTNNPLTVDIYAISTTTVLHPHVSAMPHHFFKLASSLL